MVLRVIIFEQGLMIIVNWKVSVYFQINDFLMFFQIKEMLEILLHFAITGGQLEIMLKCWSLQWNAGDLTGIHCIRVA